MTTTTVSNQTELLGALNRAQGGDTIVLKDGHYGSLKLTADFASTVTIRAEDRLGATISGLDLFGATNLTFDGINFYSGANGGIGRGIVSIELGSRGIGIVNSEVHGSDDNTYVGHHGLYVRESHNVTLRNNDVHDVDCGIVIFGTSGSEISGNRIDYYYQDAMKLAGLRSSEILGNISYGKVFKPGAVHSDFMQFQGSSSDVLIEGNAFLAGTVADVQGIFMSAGTYDRMTIENNLIHTGMVRGISISAGSGNVIESNTLLNVPGMVHNQTIILAPGGTSVQDNITTSYVGATYGSNLQLQNKNPGAGYFVGDYFQNPMKGLGATVKDLAPIAGTLGASKGADALLKVLGGGAAPAPSTPAPSTPTPAPAPSGDAIKVNAGGPAASGFAADAFYSGGSTYGTKAGIAGTTDDALYQSLRYGNFKYGLAVEDGSYAVTLKMAETHFDTAGRRVFDVKAEGKVVLDNFDIVRAAGGKNVAHDKTFTVDVTDGRLDLDFVSLVNSAQVNAIAVAPAPGKGAAPAPSTPAPSKPAPEPAPAWDAIKVNAGGPAASGFAADAFYFGGAKYGTTAGIAGTTDDALYQSLRYGNFKYGLAVEDGSYAVTLKMAETHFSAGGKRVFDVKAEGKVVLDNFDIFREAGGKNVAHDETFTVDVTDGRLDLDFVSLVNNAQVNAIAVDLI